MSPRTVCKLEKFKECSKALPNGKHGKLFCCDGHRTRFRYLMERRRRRKKRNTGLPVPCCTDVPRVSCRRYVEVGSVRKALGLVARHSPASFLWLFEAIPQAEQKAAAG
jgi:hypothetical protein